MTPSRLDRLVLLDWNFYDETAISGLDYQRLLREEPELTRTTPPLCSRRRANPRVLHGNPA